MPPDLSKPKSIKMDGAIFKLVNPQRAMIKRQRLRNLLLTGCLLPAFSIMVVLVLLDTLRKGRGMDISMVIYSLLALAFLGWVISTLVRSMRLPDITLDGITRSLTTSGKNGRSIPFDDIETISMAAGTRNVRVMNIGLTLKGGETIPLGSLSGTPKQVEQHFAEIRDILTTLAGIRVGAVSLNGTPSWAPGLAPGSADPAIGRVQGSRDGHSLGSPDKTGMRLKTGWGKTLRSPSESQIVGELQKLQGGTNSFAILEKTPNEYVQAAGGEGGVYTLEYQAGGLEHHYRAVNDADLGLVVKVFLAYAREEADWVRLAAWERMDLGGARTRT